MAIEELLEQMDAALEAEDIPTARDLLRKVKLEFGKRYAWHCLCDSQQKSYEHLIEKLELAKARHNSCSGRTHLNQLINAFRWCEEHGIELTDLEIPVHLPKYHEAARVLNRIRKRDDYEKMKEAIDEVQGHRSRDETRAWVRRRMKEIAEGEYLTD